MQDFEKHKKKFDNFLNKISPNEPIGIISHANCVDGLASAVLIGELIKKKYPSIKTDINFSSYSKGDLDKLGEKFKKEGIEKLFLVDLGVDASLFDEFEKMRADFDILMIDHHPANPNLQIGEDIIKNIHEDCSSLVIYQFGEGIIDEKEWSWLACAAGISEFSWKDKDNLKFIQKYYPDYQPGNEDYHMIKLINKLGSLVVYYSNDSLKAYQVILKKDFEKIDEIHKEVSAEMENKLRDFEKNAETHLNKEIYFYFFKSKFSLGSKMGTILSLRHRGSTIIIFAGIEGANMVKSSSRNNGEPLKYSMNELCNAAIKGLDNALAGGHAPASGASFMKKDLETFKKNVIEFVRNKLKN